MSGFSSLSFLVLLHKAIFAWTLPSGFSLMLGLFFSVGATANLTLTRITQIPVPGCHVNVILYILISELTAQGSSCHWLTVREEGKGGSTTELSPLRAGLSGVA